MAAIDYGCLFKVNGKFINKNKGLYMKASKYTCQKAWYKGKEVDLGGIYLYVGDKNFLLCFGRKTLDIVHDNILIKSICCNPFISETFYFNNLPDVKIEHLDKNMYIFPSEPLGIWEDYVKENWIGATGKEKLNELENGKHFYKLFLKNAKKNAREKRNPNSDRKYRTDRWKVSWTYKGNYYEVIFGCGIDPSEKVWNAIKYNYDFTDIEREIIDGWFKGE